MASRVKLIASVDRGKAHVSIRAGSEERLGFAGTVVLDQADWELISQIMTAGAEALGLTDRVDIHVHGEQVGA